MCLSEMEKRNPLPSDIAFRIEEAFVDWCGDNDIPNGDFYLDVEDIFL